MQKYLHFYFSILFMIESNMKYSDSFDVFHLSKNKSTRRPQRCVRLRFYNTPIKNVSLYWCQYAMIQFQTVCLQFQTQVELEKEFLKYCLNVDELDRLPEKGMDVKTVLKEAKSILALGDGDWKTGSESGTVYNGKCFFKARFPFCSFPQK